MTPEALECSAAAALPVLGAPKQEDRVAWQVRHVAVEKPRATDVSTAPAVMPFLSKL